IVERAVAMVDHGHGGEGIDAEGILRVAVEDRRGAADRLRPEARARPVGDGRVEGDAPDHRVDARKLAAVAPAHEGQRPAIGRLVAAAEKAPGEGVVGGARRGRADHGWAGGWGQEKGRTVAGPPLVSYQAPRSALGELE